MIANSAAGALRNKTTNFMCKDLGVLTPNCMVIKVRQSGLYSANQASAVGTLTVPRSDDRSYKFSLRLLPFAGASGLLANGSDHTTAAAWTQKAANAVGAARLLGSDGSTALYKAACVLRVQGRITLEFFGISSTAGILLDSADNSFTPSRSGTHFYHVRDIGETAPTEPDSQAAVDIMYAQPDMKRKHTHGLDSYLFGYRTTIPDAKAALGSVKVPPVKVSWRVNHWMHRILDMSYPAYVSDANSFAALGAAPTNYALLDLMGYFNSHQAVRKPPITAVMRYNLVWSVLLKDPLPQIV